MTTQGVVSGRKGTFVAALTSGLTQAEAAQAIGVTRRTAQRYMTDPVVRHALSQAQDQALGDVARKMNAGANEMLDVLRAVAQDNTMPPAVRVRAALGWLEVLFKAKELLELTTRVAIIEQRLSMGVSNEH